MEMIIVYIRLEIFFTEYSVTRLGDFYKFLVPTFFTKAEQIFFNFMG